jgi:prepilin signal peptidase PulO-like enzyme (type II secretory pathway)
LGTIFFLTLIGMGKMTRKSPVPFGPFLSIGALSAFFFL